MVINGKELEDDGIGYCESCCIENIRLYVSSDWLKIKCKDCWEEKLCE